MDFHRSRERALAWWRKLTDAKKEEYKNKFVLNGTDRRLHTLTGREIESIYTKIRK